MNHQQNEEVLKVGKGDLVIVKNIPKWPENCNPFMDGRRYIKPELISLINQICEVVNAYSRNNILVRNPANPSILAWVGMQDIEVMFTL